MVLCSNKIALHPTLVDLAPLVDFLGMTRDEEVGVQFEDFLLRRE
jgi:hypothetical protein